MAERCFSFVPIVLVFPHERTERHWISHKNQFVMVLNHQMQSFPLIFRIVNVNVNSGFMALMHFNKNRRRSCKWTCRRLRALHEQPAVNLNLKSKGTQLFCGTRDTTITQRSSKPLSMHLEMYSAFNLGLSCLHACCNSNLVPRQQWWRNFAQEWRHTPIWSISLRRNNSSAFPAAKYVFVAQL